MPPAAMSQSSEISRDFHSVERDDGCRSPPAEQRGVDAIIVQSTEAGGQRSTFTSVDISTQAGLFSLLPHVVDAVRFPVVAAGGLADGRI
jgi:hypothetical protein